MNREDIKNKLDIFDVVQKYVKLKRVGKYYTGLCPFHKETKPSFYVSSERQIFKCFGCGVGGDVIKFLMIIENLSYNQVLEKLKIDYGLEIENASGNKSSEKNKKIFEINYAALKFFRQEFKKNYSVFEYLKKRGLNEKTINEFEIGFSPGNTLLRDYLYSLGYDYNLIKEAGFLDSKNFDRFQSRIIFPLRAERGKLVGFSGRIFPNNLPGPKYLNSPETDVFKKSQFLYGFYYAQDFILQQKKVILVEGQLDFLLAWQNNLRNIVCISGSALTEEHLKKLKKFTQNIVLAFDNDEPGFRAELRADLLAKKNGFQTYKLIYQGKDLGEYFLIDNRSSLKEEKFEDYLLDYLLKNFNLEDKKEIIFLFLPHLKYLNPLEAREYLEKLSLAINVSVDVLEEELKKINVIVDYPIEESREIFEEKNLEEKFSLKIISLAYAIFKNLNEMPDYFQEVPSFLSSNFKNLFSRFLENKLNEDEISYLEMSYNFYLNEKINLEKEYLKTLRHLKIISLKNNLKKLNEKLKLTNRENASEIINKINDIVKELKILNKNG